MANTSAPLSEAGIASMAAGLLDDYHVTSLDDTTAIGRYMAREFGVVRDEILECYPWHCAKTRAAIAPNAVIPAFGWARAYTLPTDCLRLLPLRANGLLDGEPIPFEQESGEILTDAGPVLFIHYIRRETNVARFSPMLARAFACKLAMYASQRVTGKGGYFEKAAGAYKMALDEARLTDSLTRGTPEHQYRNDVLTVRGTASQFSSVVR